MDLNLPVQVLRIVFRSGRVVEERGTEVMVAGLFAQDDQDLIDHIMAMEMGTNVVSIYSDENDTRFDDETVMFTDDAVKRR